MNEKHYKVIVNLCFGESIIRHERIFKATDTLDKVWYWYTSLEGGFGILTDIKIEPYGNL